MMEKHAYALCFNTFCGTFDVKDATYVLYPQYCILFVYIFGTYANSFFVFFITRRDLKL